MTRDDDQHVLSIPQRLIQLRCDLQLIREARFREISDVAARTRHGSDFVNLDPPHQRGATCAGELNGECGAPGAGA